MRKLITVLGFLVLLVNISFAGMLIVDLYSEEGFGVDSSLPRNHWKRQLIMRATT
jgi:hypothetical protein